MTTTTDTLADFLLRRIEEEAADARLCAEMFPTPWDIADRGWRVRIYAGDVPVPDLSSDDEDAMTVRSPVVMEVEPDRRIEDPRWLSERVAHIARHDPARVLADCAAKRAIVDLHTVPHHCADDTLQPAICPPFFAGGDEQYRLCPTLRALALPYAQHPEMRDEWLP